MIYAAILAAGLGVRMHRQDMPKQFLPLGEKPIIIHTMEQFFINSSIDRLVIVAPKHWMPYTEDLLVKYKLTNKEFRIIDGGVNKTESIAMAARYIKDTWGIKDKDVLIAHDGIRPFVTQRILDENISGALMHGAANTAVLSNDATLVSLDGRFLHEIPPYRQMYAEQTPQSYMITKLLEVLEKAEAEGISLASEAELPRIWIRMGQKMFIVQGDYFNMKIVKPYDLEVANALLRERKV